MRRNNYDHWLKLQRKYRNIQNRLGKKSDHRLSRKLDIIARRLHSLNRKWKLGISTALLTSWLAMMPNTSQAQRSSINLGTNNASVVIPIYGEMPGDYAGRSVSSAGDINGDGIDDLIIGAFHADPGENSNAGSTYVVFGKDADMDVFSGPIDLSTLDGVNGFRVDGVSAFDESGYSVAGAGDINGDGVDDLIIGAPYESSTSAGAGVSYVIFGKNTALDGNFNSIINLSILNGPNGFRIDGVAANDSSGRSLSATGDINGDGIDDLIIGAPNADPYGNFNAGSTYVVFGKNTTVDGDFASVLDLSTLTATEGFRLDGGMAGDRSGYSLSAAGDINGDGIDDLIIGAFGADPNGYGAAGSTYVVFGKDTALDGDFSAIINLSTLVGTDGFQINGEAANDQTGFSVSGAGDVNGDGMDDLIIGAPFVDVPSNNNGASYVVFGKNTAVAGDFTPMLDLSTLSGADGFRIDGVHAADLSGYSVSGGDVNGDGLSDLIIGASNADPVESVLTGAVYVVFGKNTMIDGDFSATFNLSALDGLNGFRLDGILDSDRTGISVSGIGDFNGDGRNDLIIGASEADPGNKEDAGTAYLVFGFELDAPYITSGIPSRSLLEDQPFSLTVPAANFIDPEGEVLTFSATLANGDSLPQWLNFDLETLTFSGIPMQADLGSHVIILTATDPDLKSVNVPLGLEVLDAQTFPQSLADLNGANGFRLDGVAQDDHSGCSVSAAGDINGDGIGDLLIGAYSADPGGN